MDSTHQTKHTERFGEDEGGLTIRQADSMVPKTWDEICGMTEEDSLRL